MRVYIIRPSRCGGLTYIPFFMRVGNPFTDAPVPLEKGDRDYVGLKLYPDGVSEWLHCTYPLKLTVAFSGVLGALRESIALLPKSLRLVYSWKSPLWICSDSLPLTFGLRGACRPDSLQGGQGRITPPCRALPGKRFPRRTESGLGSRPDPSPPLPKCVTTEDTLDLSLHLEEHKHPKL